MRLAQVYAELTALMTMWEPACVAIEDVFFANNAKSALKLGQVRGVAMLAAANCGLPVAEYAPLSVKSAVVGYGLAAKDQVGFMVARLLELEESSEAGGRGRCAGDCDLPHSPCADGGGFEALKLPGFGSILRLSLGLILCVAVQAQIPAVGRARVGS